MSLEAPLTVDLRRQRAWARGWQTAGRALEAVRRAELRALTPERALAATERLLALGAEAGVSAKRRRTSGLVEQQRLFSGAKP
jgi:hypothetical protein